MKAFTIRENVDDIEKFCYEAIKQIFTGGRDFNEIMDLLPHEEDEDYREIYSDMIQESAESIASLPNNSDISNEIIKEAASLKGGFLYLYRKYPADITAEDLKGVTVEDIARRAELAMEDIEEESKEDLK